MITVREAHPVLGISDRNGTRYLVRMDGRSTDEKPDGWHEAVGHISNGSTFFEMDTGKRYMYDGDAGEWVKVSGSGGGGDGDEDRPATDKEIDDTIGGLDDL